MLEADWSVGGRLECWGQTGVLGADWSIHPTGNCNHGSPMQCICCNVSHISFACMMMTMICGGIIWRHGLQAHMPGSLLPVQHLSGGLINVGSAGAPCQVAKVSIPPQKVDREH